MPYTTNIHLPRLRMQTAKLVIEKGWSTRQAARHTGFNQSTIVRWVAKAKYTNRNTIPTESSRPIHHPRTLSKDVVQTIIDYRIKHKRCAEVVHHLLSKDGYAVSLSSVKRTIKRNNLTRYSKWKRWHQYDQRPLPERPGALVEIDTIHDGPFDDRLYIYTMIDVCSRWAFASPCLRINTHASWRFTNRAKLPFSISVLQSDHGPEFSKWFSNACLSHDIKHRYSRVRRPTDNGHLERFNRTIQEECLQRSNRSLYAYHRSIREYIHFYNTERPHMALGMKTPCEVMRRC